MSVTLQAQCLERSVDDRCEDIIEVTEAGFARYFSNRHVAVRQFAGMSPGGTEQS